MRMCVILYTDGVKISTYFNEKEFRFAELLKNMTVKEAAKVLNWSSSYAYNRLGAMRNKVEKAHNTVNTANNWKDSAKHPRLAKLLRRQGDSRRLGILV